MSLSEWHVYKYIYMHQIQWKNVQLNDNIPAPVSSNLNIVNTMIDNYQIKSKIVFYIWMITTSLI